jgi:hypothetical protein
VITDPQLTSLYCIPYAIDLHTFLS